MNKQKIKYIVIISGSRYALYDDVILKRKNGKLFYWYDDYPSPTMNMIEHRIKIQNFTDGEILIVDSYGIELNASIGRKPQKWGIDITEGITKKEIIGIKTMKYKTFNNIQDAIKESRKVAKRRKIE